MNSRTRALLSAFPYRMLALHEELATVAADLHEAGLDVPPCIDAAMSVLRIKRHLARTASTLAVALWDMEEPSPDFALDAPEPAPAVLPLPPARRTRTPHGSGNGHTST